jgi:cytochrome c-type biogenesis protein CcmH/NrfF
MSDQVRRTLRIVLPLLAVAIIVVGLWPRSDVVVTDADRVAHVASRIRCPFCNGESIGGATSQVARDLEVLIEEQVASGWTDQEIYDFFAASYGESILLSPPLAGWGWVLWALPLAALGVGTYAIMRRRRAGAGVAVAADAEPELVEAQLAEQLAQAERDRREVGDQVAAGEIDAAEGARLIASYEAEAKQLTDEQQHLAAAESASGGAPAPTRSRRWRMVAGAGFFVVGAAAVGVALVVTTSDQTGGEGVVEDAVTAGPVDLSNVTPAQLEDVVARNPDVVGMRLALAQLYYETGETSRAVDHFMEVLEREPHPEAMAWVGWILYENGEAETAQGYLENALERRPSYPQAQWWLANVRFVGLGDPAGAIGPLEALLLFDDVPDEVRQAAEVMLEEAKAAA